MYKPILSLGMLLCGLISFGYNNPNNSKISFIENKGQISDQNYKPRTDVLFTGNDGNMNFHIRNNGISYQLSKVDSWIEKEKIRGFGPITKYPDMITTYRVDINWKNSNTVTSIKTDEAIKGYSNYYLAVCPDGITNVQSFSGFTLSNVYSNIDIHYYEKGGLKCDYIIAPHANYKQIQLEVKGAEIIAAEDGGVIFKTPLGDIKEAAPVVFQNGKQLKAKWVIDENVLSFEVIDYDSNYELIIDPLTRVWGTYCGGSANDQGQSVLIDATGNTYVYGHTESSNLIATSGAHQTTFGGGGFDVFLVKFDVNGVRLWGSYVGGSGGDVASAAVIDASGNIYVSGEISSSMAIDMYESQQ